MRQARRWDEGDSVTPDGDTTRRQLTGAAGEAMAKVHLLMRGWGAGNINASVRNNAGFDLTATKAGRTVTIAVKAIGRGHQAQWGRPKGRLAGTTSLFRGETRPDFVVFVWFTGDGVDPVRHRAFVVPADVVGRDVLAAHRHWLAHPRRDGSPRNESGIIGIGFLGRDTEGNIASGFAQKWAEYEDAWDILQRPEDTSR